MTMSAPQCTCAPSILPSLGRPCPIHGDETNRLKLAGVERLQAENVRLREALKFYARPRSYGTPPCSVFIDDCQIASNALDREADHG